MRGAVLLAVVLALVAVASGYQRAFYGGDFSQADGIFSPAFAVWDDNSKGWERVPPPSVMQEGVIFDHAPAGKGVFVTGAFATINNGVPSFGVAFFDGTKWCAIRQGLATSTEQNNWSGFGTGHAVWCNSATSCYVAGSFSSIENLAENAPNNPVNFAHYIRESEEASEWVFDTSILEWNNPNLLGGITLASNTIPGTLQGVPAADPEYFFVGIGDTDSYGVGFSEIVRGGKADGGWKSYLDVGSVFGSSLRGFDVDDDGASPAVYVVSSSGSTFNFAKKSTIVLRPCPISSCSIVTEVNEWQALVPNTNGLSELFDVVAVNASTRYYIGRYGPGGNFNARIVVLQQDGFSSPVPVGAPFAQSTSVEIYRIGVHDNGAPFVVGSFRTANLEFPADTEDTAGVDLADIRELDSVNYIAIYEDGSWQSHFGGGLGPSDEENDFTFAKSLIATFNAETNKWFFTSSLITYVYNVDAEGLAFFDDDDDLQGKNIFALLTNRLVYREGSASTHGAVYDVACEEDNCKYVYAGGRFGYHGKDLLGSIAKVEVRRENPVVLAVGGGLWFTDNNIVPTDANLQFYPGQVYTLKSQGEWIYAGGEFGRGKNGYVCLSNVARIRHRDTESGSWENLGGGCDDIVYDMHFWGNDLYLAGQFENCGGTLVNYVTAYNNGAYQSLNNGLDASAYSLEFFQDRMIVGGDFSHAGGLPVDGIAAWDGQKWRALQSACTDDCVPGELTSYFTVPQRVSAVYGLHASADGTVLYGRGVVTDQPGHHLVQWKYFDQSDNGQWTIKGDLIDIDDSFESFGDTIKNNGTQLVFAGVPASQQFAHSGNSLQAYSLVNENWVDNNVLIADSVFVVRSSAASLSSFLSFLF